MKRTLLCLAAAAVLPFAATPSYAAAVSAKACVSSAGTGTCRFACTAGDLVRIVVTGSGSVQGTASCGAASAHCTGTRTCEGSDYTGTSGLGYCDLSQGTAASCWSEPAPINP